MELLQAPAVLDRKAGQAWTLQYALLNGLCPVSAHPLGAV